MSFGKLTFTPLVQRLQELYGSRTQYARMEKSAESQDQLTAYEKDFLAERDTFYSATTGSTGWPYVQHRGGPKGFLRVIDDRTLAFADFRGNRQYITAGNLMSDDRVALILVDYPHRTRLKILGHVEIFEGKKAETWLPLVSVPGYEAVIERVFVIHIEAYDWNCPQHITPRYTAEDIRDAAHQSKRSRSGCRLKTKAYGKNSRYYGSVRLESVSSSRKGTSQWTRDRRSRLSQKKQQNEKSVLQKIAGTHVTQEGLPLRTQRSRAGAIGLNLPLVPSRSLPCYRGSGSVRWNTVS